MRAKLVVPERDVLLVTSANLTQSGVAKSIEAGRLSVAGLRCNVPPSTSAHCSPAATSFVCSSTTSGVISVCTAGVQLAARIGHGSASGSSHPA
jgi:hypothetical protein